MFSQIYFYSTTSRWFPSKFDSLGNCRNATTFPISSQAGEEAGADKEAGEVAGADEEAGGEAGARISRLNTFYMVN